MAFHPIETIKKNPVAIGAVVIGGGFVFLLLTGALGGGGSNTAVSSGPSDAQLATDAQLKIAGIQANTAIAGAQLELTAKKEDNALQLAIANLAAGIQAATISAQEKLGLKQIEAATTLGTLQTNNDLEALKIQTSAQTALLGALTGGSSSSSNSTVKTNSNGGGGYSSFDYYNTENTAAPLLQGFDAAIASHIDNGEVSVTANPSGYGVVITIPGEGSYISNNPTDTRWLSYDPGDYSNNGYTGF